VLYHNPSNNIYSGKVPIATIAAADKANADAAVALKKAIPAPNLSALLQPPCRERLCHRDIFCHLTS
jgi:hypothetical protein